MSSTWPGHIKTLFDNQIRVTASGTVSGTAQAKGTATTALVAIVAGPDGATAVAGSTALTIQGSNVTATATSNWNNVTPDVGTLAAVTASGTQVVHLANLQYAYYRLQAISSTTQTSDLTVNWNFFPVADSYDATRQ